MRMVLSQTLAALVIIIGFSAASVAGSDKVLIEDAWSRASIGTSRPGVAYMKIRNTGDLAVTLRSIGTDIALKPEIHRTPWTDGHVYAYYRRVRLISSFELLGYCKVGTSGARS